MIRRLTVLECAENDIDQAVIWYEKQLPGLGYSLRLSVQDRIDAIEQYPESYQIDFGIVRKSPTHRFPYAVYYRILPSLVEIIAVLDCRLDPTTIRSRFMTDFHH